MRNSTPILLAFLLLLSSCGGLSKLSISYNGNTELKSMKGSRATFVISAIANNPTCYTLKVKKVELDVFRKGYTFAALSLSERLKVPAHSNQQQELQLQVHFKDYFALHENDFDIESEEYTLSGYIKVGVGLFSKKYKLEEELSFNQLIRKLENL